MKPGEKRLPDDADLEQLAEDKADVGGRDPHGWMADRAADAYERQMDSRW